MKKKLFFAMHNLDIGGIEKAMINLLDAIDFDKYDVTVLLQEKRGMFLDDVPSDVHIKEYRISKSSFVIFRKIINRLKVISYCIMNYHKYDYSCAYATYDTPSTIIARFLSKNTCIFVHGDYTMAYDKKGFIKFFVDRKIDKFKSIVFVSEDSKVKFEKIFPNLSDRCFVINNQVNIENIIKASKEKIDIKKRGFTFIYIGRLDEKAKKISRMISSIDKIKDTYLWIVGDGPDREMYKQMIKEKGLEERILLLGKQHNPYKYLSKADSLLMTSEYEGFPVVYLESLVLKKQIVTTIPLKCNGLDISKYSYIATSEKSIEKKMKEAIKKPKKVDFDVNKFNQENLKRLEKVINGKI